MNRRTRVGSTIDTNRLGAAISRPGIDPRIWCSLAYAADESVLDEEHGDFVDVVLLPSQQEVTVRVPQAYAGKSFGSGDGRIHKDDEIVVLLPDGDPAAGGIVVARLWGAIDLPPQLAIDHPNDIIRVLEAGIGWRAAGTGDGSVIDVEVEDDITVKTTKKTTFDAETVIAKTGNVRLGDEDAAESLILGDTYRNQEGVMNAAFQSALAQFTSAGAQLVAAAPLLLIPIGGPIAASPLILAAGTLLTAGAAAMNAAIAAFEGAAPTYLSGTSKTK